LAKPFDQAALVARVQSMLRIKELHDTVNRQAEELREQASQLQEWNLSLEARVKEQVDQLERVGRLKRFFSPQLVERLISSGDESILESHRREITVVFCDLRGFTRFCETKSPHEVMSTVREYHGTCGPLILKFEGTLEQFAGDGFMVFFNDPEPIPDHAGRAVAMALEMRNAMDTLCVKWRDRGYDLGFGVGIANGEATLGMVGFEGRIDYAAIGPVSNFASRLSDLAAAGEILISQGILESLESRIRTHAVGEQNVKGLEQPVPVYRLIGMNF
jgi:class 3 adenylate cyclase